MLAASLNKYVCDIRASWEWGIRRKRRSWCYFLNWTMFWACCFHPIWVFFFVLFPRVKVNDWSGGMRTSAHRITQEELSLLHGGKESKLSSFSGKQRKKRKSKVHSWIWKHASLLHRCCFKDSSDLLFIVVIVPGAWKFLNTSTSFRFQENYSR